jgi:Legume-like lectin family
MHLLSLLLLPLLAVSSLPQDPSLSLSHPFASAKLDYDTFGSVTLLSDTIVLTPHSPGHQLGALWSKSANPHQYWEAEFVFRVSGSERGGNGLAFWYSATRGQAGPVFGSVDQWDGLGLFFDPNGGGRSSVRGHLNDGAVKYAGLSDLVGSAFGACPFVFRGTPQPITVKITNSRESFRVPGVGIMVNVGYVGW